MFWMLLCRWTIDCAPPKARSIIPQELLSVVGRGGGWLSLGHVIFAKATTPDFRSAEVPRGSIAVNLCVG